MKLGFAATLLALGLTAPANAGTLETVEVPSACVEPGRVVMSDPPAGKPSRPPALRVNVLLPDGYDGRRRLPVLYLLHGLGGAYDYWFDASHGELAKAVSNLEAIVVMPEGGTVAMYANYWAAGVRTPCWERYLLEELIPAIEQRFRVRPGRRWHAVAGFSSGGTGAVLLAARRPDYFGQVLSFSGVLSLQRPETQSGVAPTVVAALYAPTKLGSLGPLFLNDVFGDPQAQEFYWAGHNPPVLAAALSASRIYVSHGGPTAPTCIDPLRPIEHCAAQEILGGTTEANFNGTWAEEFVAAARTAGATVTYRPGTGGHFYTYSSRFLADAIRHWGLFEAVPGKPDDWTYKTVSQRGRMWDLRFAFAQPPQALEVFMRRGNRVRGEGHGALRLRTAQSCEIGTDLPFDLELPRDDTPPTSRVRRAIVSGSRGLVTVTGSAHDRGCGTRRAVRRVQVAIGRRTRRKCRFVQRDGRLGRTVDCSRPRYLPTRGTAGWVARRRVQLPPGRYFALSRAQDLAGQFERGSRRSGARRNHVAFRAK